MNAKEFAKNIEVARQVLESDKSLLVIADRRSVAWMFVGEALTSYHRPVTLISDYDEYPPVDRHEALERVDEDGALVATVKVGDDARELDFAERARFNCNIRL